jgi:hypothetical protein
MNRMTVVAAMLLAASTVASAGQGDEHSLRDFSYRFHDRFHDRSSVVPVAAPEIDPASVVAGLTLLGGGLAVLRGRRSMKPIP